jgi:PspA-Associated protein
VIVRIATEGQYELDDDDVDTLNQLDNQAVAASDDNDEQRFQESFQRLVEFVRDNGRALEEDRLEPSDVILPPADTSLAEARAEFSGEGLIPG